MNIKNKNQKNQLFDLGRTMATPGAIEALQQFGVSAASLLGRHQRGDWEDLENKDTYLRLLWISEHCRSRS